MRNLFCEWFFVMTVWTRRARRLMMQFQMAITLKPREEFALSMETEPLLFSFLRPIVFTTNYIYFVNHQEQHVRGVCEQHASQTRNNYI